jgi:hypothetical protein
MTDHSYLEQVSGSSPLVGSPFFSGFAGKSRSEGKDPVILGTPSGANRRSVFACGGYEARERLLTVYEGREAFGYDHGYDGEIIYLEPFSRRMNLSEIGALQHLSRSALGYEQS